MGDLEGLLSAKRPFLTDGGLETWLFFQQGFDAPHFAAITLMDDAAARAAMRRYFDEFLALASSAGTGFVIDTNTWRGCTAWAPKLGLGEADLLRLAGEAVRFAQGLRTDWRARLSAVVVNGVVGPAGDAYRPDAFPNADQAQAIHTPLLRELADGGVDMVSAVTMTNVDEAVGIVRAAGALGLPSVVSFTVETDGRLPTGLPLGEAIEAVDVATGNVPAYYMVNCAHPEHFVGALADGGRWVSRIGGVRANASRRSHAELDEAEVLDQGDPEEFGSLHVALANLLPNLRVVGGCCGTDHRHVAQVSEHLHQQPVG